MWIPESTAIMRHMPPTETHTQPHPCTHKAVERAFRVRVKLVLVLAPVHRM